MATKKDMGIKTSVKSGNFRPTKKGAGMTEKGVAAGGMGSAGTFDWGGYFNTQYFADPVEGIIGIIMKQTRGESGDETGWRFRLLVGQTVDE